MLVVNILFVNQPIRYFNWPYMKEAGKKKKKKRKEEEEENMRLMPFFT
jgi:hypothetical protein